MGRAERELRGREGDRVVWGHWEGAVRTEGQRLWGERAGWEGWRGTEGRRGALRDGGQCEDRGTAQGWVGQRRGSGAVFV